MNMKYITVILILFSIQPLSLSGQKNSESTTPSGGYLILCGSEANSISWNKFIELAGGKHANYLVVPTSVSDQDLSRVTKEMINTCKKRGLKNIDVLHTRSKEIANSDSLATKIREANGVWFNGGETLNYAEAYLNTKVQSELIKLLERGGVIMGQSAGANIMGSYLLRGTRDHNRNLTDGLKEGFGFISNCVIASHVLERNYHFDITNVRKKNKDLLGIGLDKGTVILLHNNQFQVLSKEYALVYDGQILNGGKNKYWIGKQSKDQFYFLTAGEEYNTKDRSFVFWENKKEVKLPNETLQKYVGTYKRDNQDVKLYLSLDGNRLKVNTSWNDYTYQLISENDVQFYRQEDPIKVNFEFDENKEIVGFTFYQQGVIRHWTKENDD